MINRKYLAKLRSSSLAYAERRREVIKATGDALHHAKRAIFALHRDDYSEADAKLGAAAAIFVGLQKKYKKDPAIFSEGSYDAALEEYVEARLFYTFLTTGEIGLVLELSVPDETYLAGLCDVPGELYRCAIKSATDRDFARVRQCAGLASEIVGELIEFNLTSYLRTKFDQAKQAAQKLEQVVYEVSLRQSPQ